jgi:hypothetical protein
MVLNAAETFKKEMYFENISFIRNKWLWRWDSIFRWRKRGETFLIPCKVSEGEHIQFVDWVKENTIGNVHILLSVVPRFSTGYYFTHRIPVIVQHPKDIMLIKLTFNLENLSHIYYK